MLADKVPQGIRIGLRPNGTAVEVGVVFRIERCSECETEGQETNLIWSEHSVREESSMCARNLSFCDFRPRASEALCLSRGRGRRVIRTLPARVELITNLFFAFWTGPHKSVRFSL
jgi:hypothetical protein